MPIPGQSEFDAIVEFKLFRINRDLEMISDNFDKKIFIF